VQGNGRRHVLRLPIRGAFSQQAADTIDWTVRCDWLQVASSCMILYTHNIMLASFYRRCDKGLRITLLAICQFEAKLERIGKVLENI